MGDKLRSQSSKAEILAFHAALVRIETERGTMGRLIPTDEWEGLIVDALDAMTRQNCQDKTWALQRMGLIQREPRKGVKLL